MDEIKPETNAEVKQPEATPAQAPAPPVAASAEKPSRTRAKAEAAPTEKLAEVKPAEAKIEKKEIKAPLKPKFDFKVFGRWSADVPVLDQGLKPYLNLTGYFVPYSAGRTIKKQFWKSKKSIIERLMAKLMVTGHKGKKHSFTSGINTGKVATHYTIIKHTFELIEQRTKKNPIEVLVRALEVGSPREGIATIEYGGVRYPKAADVSPQRRIDLVLRWMTQGAFANSRKGKKHIWEALADEIMAAANNDQQKSNALTKRQELERQSEGSR